MKKIVLMLLMCCISLQCVGHGLRLRYKSPRMPKRSSINYRFSRALERAQHEHVVTHNSAGKVTVRETLNRTEPARPLKLRPQKEMQVEFERMVAQFGRFPFKQDCKIRCQINVLGAETPVYDRLKVEDIKERILDYNSRARQHNDPIMHEIVKTLEWMINAREKLPVESLKLRSKGEMEAKIERH